MQAFPEHVSLCDKILFSRKTMDRIRNLVMGKHAFLVPHAVNNDVVRLAAKLELPILGTVPSVAQVYGSKSGAKRIFAAADVLTPVGEEELWLDDSDVWRCSPLVMTPSLVLESLGVKWCCRCLRCV